VLEPSPFSINHIPSDGRLPVFHNVHCAPNCCLAVDEDKPSAGEGTASEHIVMVQFDSPDAAQAWKNRMHSKASGRTFIEARNHLCSFCKA
jgi:hypothetical protein